MSATNASEKQPGGSEKRLARSKPPTALQQTEAPLTNPCAELEKQLQETAAELAQLKEALGREIAARQQAEAALHNSELKFRAIAQSANDAIIAADGQGQITFWNKGAQNIFGYTEAEMLGRPLTTLMPDHYKAAHQSGLERFQSTGEAKLIGKTVEFEGRRKDAHEFPLELSLNTWMTGTGSFFSGIIRDVTDRKEAEKMLAEQDNVLRTLIDILPDYVYIKDTHNGHVINNMAHVRLWGPTTANSNNGKPDSDLSIRELAAQYYAHEQEVIRTGQPLLNKEETVLDPRGRKHWLLTTTVPLRNEHGEITALVGVSRDITERRKAEEERDRFFALSLDLLAVAGMDGYLKQVNPAWEKILGYPEEQLLAKPFIELIHPADRAVVQAELQQLATGLDTVSFEIRLICADGTYCWMSWNVTAIVTDGLLFGVGRNITKGKQAETENVKLFEALNRQRAELRPPMLDDYGLVDALEWYADRLAARFGLTITVQGEALTPRLSPAIENTLFRIAQEALTNVAKHACATEVMLSLAADNQTVRLAIADNGHGFEPVATHGATKWQGWGLRMMGERAEMIGGRCWIESQPNQGTRVAVEVSQ